jgi:hypothetical protein
MLLLLLLRSWFFFFALLAAPSGAMSSFGRARPAPAITHNRPERKGQSSG